MSDVAIETEELAKSFGDTRALDGINLSVPTGGVFGLLGPNGAGKTTAIRIFATLSRPDSGRAAVFGHDVTRESDAVRARISLTGQFASVDEDLTGEENIVLLARLLGFSKQQAKSRSDELLTAFGLNDSADKQAKNYSGGLRRRLDIAASLIVTPDLMFLDEPTTGLDPRSRNQVWEIVRGLVASGTTVLLTTQYLEEADQLADAIAVIDHGRLIAEGTSGELKSSVGSGALHVRVADASQREIAADILSNALSIEIERESDPAGLSARVSDENAAAKALLLLTESKVGIDSYSLGQPSLDEVFFALTGHKTEEEAENDNNNN